MKQLDERVRASEGMDLLEQGLQMQKRSVDLIAPAHASTRVPGAVVQHSPGPWKVRWSKPLPWAPEPEPDGLLDANGDELVFALASITSPSNRRALANTFLAAAAPELLDALYRLMNCAGEAILNGTEDELCEAANDRTQTDDLREQAAAFLQARAAVKKARQRTPRTRFDAD